MKFETTIIGRVGRDAEMREVNGKKITSYTVATSPAKDKTVWVKVTTWDKSAENDAKYVKKGMMIFVRGNLQFDENGLPRTYTKDGVTKASQFELTGYEVKYLTKVQPEEAVSQPSVDLSSLGLDLDTNEEIPF